MSGELYTDDSESDFTRELYEARKRIFQKSQDLGAQRNKQKYVYPMDKIDEEASSNDEEESSNDDENEFQEVPQRFLKVTVSETKTRTIKEFREIREICEICKAPIQGDSDDDDDACNRWFIRFFNGLIFSGFIIYIIMIVHSEFILPKKIEEILTNVETRATEGIIVQVSGPIMQVVNWGNYCFQRMLNRL